MKQFLEYVSGVMPKDGFARKVDEEVQRVKESREWRKEYMLMEIRDRENFEKGKELGIRQEQQKIVAMMRKHGCSISDISRMLEMTEEEVQQALGR